MSVASQISFFNLIAGAGVDQLKVELWMQVMLHKLLNIFMARMNIRWCKWFSKKLLTRFSWSSLEASSA